VQSSCASLRSESLTDSIVRRAWSSSPAKYRPWTDYFAATFGASLYLNSVPFDAICAASHFPVNAVIQRFMRHLRTTGGKTLETKDHLGARRLKAILSFKKSLASRAQHLRPALVPASRPEYLGTLLSESESTGAFLARPFYLADCQRRLTPRGLGHNSTRRSIGDPRGKCRDSGTTEPRPTRSKIRL
jgi:hypothetical protein